MTPDEFPGGPVDAFSSNDPTPPGPLPYADVTNPQSLNKYSYALNNPLRYRDPNGHCVEDLCVVEGTLVVGGFLLLSYAASAQGQEAIRQGVQKIITTGVAVIASLAADAEAGELDKKAQQAATSAGQAIAATEGGQVAEKATEGQKAKISEKVAELAAGTAALGQARQDLKEAKGGKAIQAAKEAVAKTTQTVAGHAKALQQLVQNILKNSAVAKPKKKRLTQTP